MNPHVLTPPTEPRRAVRPKVKPLYKPIHARRPKILLVTPELSESRSLARNGKEVPCVKAGGLADMSALLVDSLTEAGAIVHVAMPHYRSLFEMGLNSHSRRLHLCEDKEFSSRRSVYEGGARSNLRGALAFQRDVIHYLLPKLQPDLVHCNDWMTGLVPAAARSMGIPSLFTLHNIYDEWASLRDIEGRGIDAEKLWQNLYFKDFPKSYESARNNNSVSLLASGILAADTMNTVSPSFLSEIAACGHGVSMPVVNAVSAKIKSHAAYGILNSLSSDYSPDQDNVLPTRYDSTSHIHGKRANKRVLQEMLGLEMDDEAPVLFWPSRLDPAQKGCQLLADILYQTVSDYWALGLQVVFVADGLFSTHFKEIARFHGLSHRIAVRGFDPKLSLLGYAASDFTLMPSAYEPCGLSQMIGLRYGSLPVVHATGGLRDTIEPLNCAQNTGNGFAFMHHDSKGLRWAIDEAIRFYIRPEAVKRCQISRIMNEAREEFSPSSMIKQYLCLYRKILGMKFNFSL